VIVGRIGGWNDNLTNFVKILQPVLLRQPAAFLLLLSFLAQSFSKYIIVVDYCANTAAYAEKCVNKDKPWMHCNGRCQLCKKMAQQENPDKPRKEPVTTKMIRCPASPALRTCRLCIVWPAPVSDMANWLRARRYKCPDHFFTPLIVFVNFSLPA
jgi:hypothetical protein